MSFRNFGDTSITPDALQRAIGACDREVCFSDDFHVDDTGREKCVSINTNRQRQCFVLIDGATCDECEFCPTCQGAAVAAPVAYDPSRNGLFVRCCSTVVLNFLYMDDADLCAIRKFTCEPNFDSQCLCTATVDGGCTDRGGCLIICAYKDTNTGRWISDYRPNPTYVAEVVSTVTPARETTLGCGEVIQRKLIDADDLTTECCQRSPTRVVNETVTVEYGEHNEFEFDLEIPDDCPMFCLSVHLTPPPNPDPMSTVDTWHCAEFRVRGNGNDERIALGDGSTTGRLCFSSGGSYNVRLFICPFDWLSLPAYASQDFEVEIWLSTVADLCTTEGCAELVPWPGASKHTVYNAGEIARVGQTVLVSKDMRCKPVTHGRGSKVVYDCDCLTELGFCDVITLQFSGVEYSEVDPEDGTPWTEAEKGPCDCQACNGWNRVFELRRLEGTDDGGTACGYALVNECFTWTGIAPCGPYTVFPCSEVGDNTGLHVTFECLENTDIDCGESPKILRTQLFFLMRGCDWITYAFDEVPIPDNGDMQIQATAVTDHTGGESVAFGTTCLKDMSLSNAVQTNNGQAGGLPRCDERL